MDIKYGNTDGKYFTQWRFDILTRLAEELNEYIPHATNWSIWYDAPNDFHRLEFDVDGHHYAVRYYKVFAISRDGNDSYFDEPACKNYGHYSSNLVQLFKSGRHKTWEDAKTYCG